MYIAHTYCDFGTPGRKTQIARHLSPETGMRQFKRLSRIYTGYHGARCWLVHKGRVLADTGSNRNDGA